MRVRVGLVSELPEGAQKSVRVGRQSVLVVNDGGRFYALRNLCTHESYPLEGGRVENGMITCEAHGARFDLATGAARSMPAVKAVRLYRAVQEGAELFVEEL
ncbi:3-phenylpropionate/trans-cinnamate dioxygenase ferredoxin subunit [Deinobacterium chartae]|uniref:3-phenylpropionate/trans-cinnamate dioxygenase ferredoxin subunit n=1 Tax=Deinobacterium chartae TaxID=521158 RepID=A0A841HZD7_9DEIO|nr:non-heme iron oxygenase ferredoxin subunit [Deinobacterium chartae]MBB6097570.1 3-phenylpropionate/trans-cinnamate dioxygenase ferredoxin subunit [Deinobacterium chartae]